MRVCFAGTGSIGARHIRNLATICEQDGESLVVDLVRSSDRPLPEDIERHIGETFGLWNEVEGGYDGVFIANPTHLHAETLRASALSSHSFFVEKPLAQDVVGVEADLLALPTSNTYYVACPLRYTRALLEAEHIVSKHRVFSASSASSSYLPDWRVGVDYRQVYSAHKDEGGGVPIDLIHEWDYLVHLFGFPQSVAMMAGTYSCLEIDSEDIAVYIARYERMLVEVHLDYFGREPRRTLDLYTADARYVVDILHSRLYRNGRLAAAWPEEPNDKYLREMRLFVDIMRKRILKSPNAIEDAIRVQRISQGVFS